MRSVAQTVSLRREFERKGNSKIERGEEADWQVLTARPLAGAHKIWGERGSLIALAVVIQYSMLALGQARRFIYMYARREVVF